MFRRFFLVVAVIQAVASGAYGYGVQEYSEEMYRSRMYPTSGSDAGSFRVFDNFFSDIPSSEMDVALVWESGYDFYNATLCLSIIDYRTPYNTPGNYASEGELQTMLYHYGAGDFKIGHSAEDCPFGDLDGHEVCRLVKAAFDVWDSQKVSKASWMFSPSDNLEVTLGSSAGGIVMPANDFFDLTGSDIVGIHVGNYDGDFTSYYPNLYLRWYCVGGKFYPVYIFSTEYYIPDEMLSGHGYTSYEYSFFKSYRSPSDALESLDLPPDTYMTWTADTLPTGVALINDSDNFCTGFYKVR